MLMTYHVFISFGSVYGFIVVAALIGFNYGGSFALFPAITADYFGKRASAATMAGYSRPTVWPAWPDRCLRVTSRMRRRVQDTRAPG